jgi:hypothetical protein
MIKPRQRVRIEVLTLSAALAVGLAACGGSSTSHTSKTSAAPATGSQIHAVLVGQDHDPKATKPWFYTVRITSADGKPLAATVETEFAYGGQVVGRESPPTHRLPNGVLKDKIEFPKQAVGLPIALRVVVRTSAGSKTLNWPVSVQP